MIKTIIFYILFFIIGEIVGIIFGLFVTGIGRSNKEYEFYQKGFSDGYEETKEEEEWGGDAGYSLSVICGTWRR